jgi:hypothetical protein
MAYRAPLLFNFPPADPLLMPPLLVAARANAFAVGVVPNGYNGDTATVAFSVLPNGQYVAVSGDGLSFYPVTAEQVTRYSIPGIARQERSPLLPGESAAALAIRSL